MDTSTQRPKIIAIAQLENDSLYIENTNKQTILPDYRATFIDMNPAKTINQRRQKIAQNHKKLRELVKSSSADLVWQLEGDSIVPKDCLERLLKSYYKLDCAFISGVQVGRHGLYHLGAWVNFTENSFESIDHKLDGIQEVEAVGMYCLLASKEKWLEGKCEWSGEVWGPDVNWSRSITGKKYVDMSLDIGHKIKSGIIYKSHQSTVNVRFKRMNDKWGYKIL